MVQRAQGAVGALELRGVGVALMADQRLFADARIGLAQPHAVLVAIAFGCMVVSMMTRAKSAGLEAGKHIASCRINLQENQGTC